MAFYAPSRQVGSLPLANNVKHSPSIYNACIYMYVHVQMYVYNTVRMKGVLP